MEPMRDWRAIARAQGLEHNLDRIVAPLDALEEAFRPLVRDLTPADEPATAFTVETEEGVQ